MKFTQDFSQDLEVILNAFTTERFCLIRFGDGESAILRNRDRPFRTHREGESWDSRKIPAEVKTALGDALAADLPDLYVATICPACSGQSSEPLRAHVKCPLERQTYAEILGNANWPLLEKHVKMLRGLCFLVSSAPEADLQIPSNLPEQSLEEHFRIVDQLSEVRTPIALAAGPSACVLGHQYWLRADEKRQTCIDVGALFDQLYWRNTRDYMPEDSARRRRVCTWDGVGVGLDTG